MVPDDFAPKKASQLIQEFLDRAILDRKPFIQSIKFKPTPDQSVSGPCALPAVCEALK